MAGRGPLVCSGLGGSDGANDEVCGSEESLQDQRWCEICSGRTTGRRRDGDGGGGLSEEMHHGASSVS